MADKKMQIVYKQIESLKKYENNPRNNEKAVEKVAKSIHDYGFRVPVIIDANDVIVAGHTRVDACRKLGIDSVPCVVADDLNDEQIKAFRIVDNKTSEYAEWDDEKLQEELEQLSIDLSDFDLQFEQSGGDEEPQENLTTSKTEIPQYEPTGVNMSLDECLNSSKTYDLILEIEQSNLSKDEKDFLKMAAYRHLKFNYKNIAEYYANNASPEMQRLMERSALVIIDIDNAIANGYVRLCKDIEEIMGADDEQ